MFTRPRPYTPTGGIKIADYVNPRQCFNAFPASDTRPPVPNNPVNIPRHPDDDPPPTLRPPKVVHNPNPLRRKDRHEPRHLSSSKRAVRSGSFTAHRAQNLKQKRDNARKRNQDRQERLSSLARERISKLRREAETLMTPQHMNNEDKIFLAQLERLELNTVLDDDLEGFREVVSRAAAEAPQRRLEENRRDREAAKKWGAQRNQEPLKKQKRVEEAAMSADEERRRMYEAFERQVRQRQEQLYLARKAKEDEENRRQEEMERKEREQREQKERQLREEQERKLREEDERRRWELLQQCIREAKERLAKEERERQARFFAEQEQARRAAQQDEQARQHLVLYEGKWDELRTNNAVLHIDVRELPWPVFAVVSSANQITSQDVRTFLFHPQRPGVEGKTTRDKIKAEILRFHPDKFNMRVLPKVQPFQQAVAQEIAGAVARILTEILAEEVAQQK